jgi:hypothetical protein
MAYDDPNPLEYPSNEPPDATTDASPPAEGYEPHPLFPLDHDGRDPRDLQFITFRRRHSRDGRLENCPEDLPAAEIQSWAEVVAWWGGGEYQAVAKNRHHRVIASSPQNSEWMLFDTESKPFTPFPLRNRSRHSPPMPAAPAATPTPPPNPAPPAPASPFELTVVVEILRELWRQIREIREERARQPASDPVVVEILWALWREIREERRARENARAEMVQALTMALAPRTQR